MISNKLPSWGTCVMYILLTICTIFLIITWYKAIQRRFLTFVFGRNNRRWIPDANHLHEHPSQLQSVGLAAAVIHSLPAIQFREEIKQGSDHIDNTDCAVCLGEFLEGEWLRLLPNCAHVFHVGCIDTWFRAHSTCPLCRMDVLYDFNSCGSSVSMVALLATLRREDTRQERPLGHRLLDSETLQNPEFRLGAMRSHLMEIDSDESFLAVSPAIGPNINRIATENLVEPARIYKGESSSGDRNVQAMSASPESSMS